MATMAAANASALLVDGRPLDCDAQARRDRTDRQNFTRRARPPLPRAPSTNASIVRSTPRSTSVPSRRRSPRRASKVNLTVIIVIASR